MGASCEHRMTVLFSSIGGWVPDEQFLEVAGFDGPVSCGSRFVEVGAESE